MASPDEQCPTRGPGLHHTFDYGTSGYDCIDCGVQLVVNAPVSPPLDIGTRWRELMGMAGKPAGPGEPPPHQDGTLVEPKSITGQGPQGSDRDKGRGELSFRQKGRLAFLRWMYAQGRLD